MIIATRLNRGPNETLDHMRANLSYGRAVLRHLPELQRALTGP